MEAVGQREDRARLARRFAVASGVALLMLGVLWVPWRGSGAAGQRAPLEAHAAWAASVISGTVSWKGTDKPVDGVQVVLKDPKQGAVVAEATTDAEGTYMLASAGVGDWLVDVPSTGGYWGYAQTVTVFPHDSYHLDFGITVRPPDAPTPTALPTQTPAPLPVGAGSTGSGAGAGPTPGTNGSGGGKLPPAGRPLFPAAEGSLLALSALLLGLGWALRQLRAGAKELR
jgi:hypothetical protein